jgi:hypothetical protein
VIKGRVSGEALLEGINITSPVVILQVLLHLVIKGTVSGDALLEGLYLASPLDTSGTSPAANKGRVSADVLSEGVYLPCTSQPGC